MKEGDHFIFFRYEHNGTEVVAVFHDRLRAFDPKGGRSVFNRASAEARARNLAAGGFPNEQTQAALDGWPQG